MGHPVLGDDVRPSDVRMYSTRSARLVKCSSFTDRRPVVGLDVLGQRVGEVVPVLGVQRAQIAVFDLLDGFDVGQIVEGHPVIAAHG